MLIGHAHPLVKSCRSTKLEGRKLLILGTYKHMSSKNNAYHCLFLQLRTHVKGLRALHQLSTWKPVACSGPLSLDAEQIFPTECRAVPCGPLSTSEKTCSMQVIARPSTPSLQRTCVSTWQYARDNHELSQMTSNRPAE